MSTSNQKQEQTISAFSSYAEFSKTLRTWFVAFGIGGPVVLLSNEKLWPTIVASGLAFDMGLLFLLGGGIQIISALLNKHAMWHLYFAEDANTVLDSNSSRALKRELAKRAHHKNELIYHVSYWYSYQNWIDELLDLFTLVMFAWATALAFVILSPSPEKNIIRDDEKSRLAWIIGIIASAIITVIWQAIGRRKPVEPPASEPSSSTSK